MDAWFAEEAVEAFAKVLQIDPAALSAQERLGVALYRLGRLDEAVEALRKAVSYSGALPSWRVSLGCLLLAAGREVEGRRELAAASVAAGSDARALVAVGSSFLEWGEAADAEAAVRASVALAPREWYPRQLLARILSSTGKFSESAAVLRAGLEEIGGNASAYLDWAYTDRAQPEHIGVVETMEATAAKPTLGLQDQDRSHFALGKAYDNLGRYDEALRHFRAANLAALARLTKGGADRVAVSATVDRMLELFTREFFTSHPGSGLGSDCPILIVGLPRSGTTLVEQILSSHPEVGGAGEIRFIPDHAQRIIGPTSFDDALLPDVASQYLRRLKLAAPAFPRITDKMPTNHLFAGLVHALLPNARIVHCRRNPLDNCLSLFVTPHDQPTPLLHPASDIAFLWKQHERLLRHWQAVLPPTRFATVDYESLVADREAVLRPILDFLELEWSDACLHHEENRRAINTPSQWQARQGFYNSSVGRWRHYQPWIDELLPLLEGYEARDSENEAQHKG